MTTHDAATSPTMYCRLCSYALVGLSENRCPECGQPFDPNDPRTYLRQPWQAQVWRWAKRVFVSLLVLAALTSGSFGLLYWRWQAYQQPAFKQLGTNLVYAQVGPSWLKAMLGQRYGYLLYRPYAINTGGHANKTPPIANLGWVRPIPSVSLLVPVPENTLGIISGLPTIRNVDVAGHCLSDEDVRHIATLKNLWTLDLEATDITDSGLSRLADLRQIRHLYLTDTAISEVGLAHLKKMSRLDTLSLSNTKVTDDGLKHLANLAALEWLSLDGTAITDAGLVHLASLPSLRLLHLENTAITPEGLHRLRNDLPNLRVYGPH